MRKINYKIYHHGNEVIAVSTFAKRTVKGTAKCDPRDKFDHKKGEALAIARCDVKVAEKRMKSANEQVQLYKDCLDDVLAVLSDAIEYKMLAKRELDAAKAALAEVERTM